jgi:uncharacterized alpha-E superfamily protein
MEPGRASLPSCPVCCDPSPSLAIANPVLSQRGPARLVAPEQELLSVIRNPRRSGSLASVLSRLGNVVGTVRDRISTDMWRVGRRYDQRTLPPRTLCRKTRLSARRRTEWGAAVSGLTLIDELNHLDRVVLVLAAFGGLAAESVTREEGWRFLDMGRKMERALHTITMVQSAMVSVSPPGKAFAGGVVRGNG